MISLRKINSILVIIIILLFLNHAVLSILFLYGLIDYSPSFKETGIRLFYPLVLHVIISLYLYIKDNRWKNKIYPKLINETTQQLLSGIGIAVFASLHILSYMLIHPSNYHEFHFKLMHFFIDILLFVSISMHLRVSIPRLAVSLGFLENKNSYSKFNYICNIVVLIFLVIAVFAEIVTYWVIL